MTPLKSLLAAAILLASLTALGGCTPAVGDGGEALPGVTTPSETEFDFEDRGPTAASTR